MDVTSYLLGKKSSGGGGGSDIDWSQIGYSSEPTSLKNMDEDAFEQALDIKERLDNLANNKAIGDVFVPNEMRWSILIWPDYDYTRFTSVSPFITAFNNCYALLEVPKIKARGNNLSSMFNACYSLKGIDVSEFDTSSATDISQIFRDCKALKTININNFDCSNVTSMNMLFYGDYNLETINMNLVDTPKVTDVSSMFSECQKIETIDISKLDTRNATTIQSMFYKCSALTHITFGNNFAIPKVTNIGTFINSCPLLDDETLNNVMGILLTATSYTGTKTLKKAGFSSTQAIKCQTLSNWSALSSAGWTTGY